MIQNFGGQLADVEFRRNLLHGGRVRLFDNPSFAHVKFSVCELYFGACRNHYALRIAYYALLLVPLEFNVADVNARAFGNAASFEQGVKVFHAPNKLETSQTFRVVEVGHCNDFF